MYLIGVGNMKTTKKMVAKVNKLEAENRRLKELLIHAGIDAWHVPDLSLIHISEPTRPY